MGSSFLHLQAVVTYLLGQKMRPLIMNAEAISPKASSAILSSATTGMLHARILSFPTNVDSSLQTPISLAIPSRKTRFESILRRKNARRCYTGHDQWQSRAMHMGMSLRNLALDDRGVYLRWGVSRNSALPWNASHANVVRLQETEVGVYVLKRSRFSIASRHPLFYCRSLTFISVQSRI